MIRSRYINVFGFVMYLLLRPRETLADRYEREMIEEALGLSAGRKVQVKTSVRGERAGYLDLVRRNAEMALATELGSNAAQRARADALREMLGLDELPQRIERFDLSQPMGRASVAPMAWNVVSAGQQSPSR